MRNGAYATVLVSFILVVTIYSAVILATTSSDWLSPVKISYDDFNHSNSPAIAADSNGIHIVWQDDRDGNYAIYYADSSDGSTWSKEKVIGNPYDSWYPDIAVDSNGAIHIVWSNYTLGNIFYARSPNWNAETIAYNGSIPAISISGNGVHIVWQDHNGLVERIYYKKLDLDGGTLIDDTLLAGYSSMNPDIASSSNNVYVVWHDSRTGNNQVYFKKSATGGSTWSGDTDISNSVYDSVYPAVAVGPDGKIYIAWSDYRNGNSEVYYAYSSDGSSWTEPIRVTYGSTDSSTPDIAVDSHGIHIVWYSTDAGYNTNISYANSIDGYDWSISELGRPNQNSSEPRIAIYGGSTHVVWTEDHEDGSYNDIYYIKKKPLSLVINHNTSDSTIVLGEDSRDGIAIVNYNITPSTFSGTVFMDVYDENNKLFYHQDDLDYNSAVWDGTDGKGNYADPEKNYTIKITASD